MHTIFTGSFRCCPVVYDGRKPLPLTVPEPVEGPFANTGKGCLSLKAGRDNMGGWGGGKILIINDLCTATQMHKCCIILIINNFHMPLVCFSICKVTHNFLLSGRQMLLGVII